MDSSQAPPPAIGNPKVSERTLLGVVWSGLIITLIFFAFRIYVRVRSFRKLYVDDALILLAWLMILATSIIWQTLSGAMYRSLFVISGKVHHRPPTFVNDEQNFLHGSAVVIVLFYSSLWAVKLSFLFFFRRLVQGVARQEQLWWAVLAITVGSYFACIGTIEYNCLLPSFAKVASYCDGLAAIRFQRTTLHVTCALDVITDALIMAIPISLLWKVQITLRQKVALAGIFSLAIITISFAIIRVTAISVLTQQPDVSWLYMWSSIEQTVAIIVVCLASFRALFTREGRRCGIPNGGSNLRKLFLPAAIRHNGQITTFISASSENETKFLTTSSDESNASVVPPDKVHVRHEINQSVSPSELEHGRTEDGGGYHRS